MKLTGTILLVLSLCSSCAVMDHLDEATTLQDYSHEQDALQAMVEKQDRAFVRLLARIASGDRLTDLKDRAALLDALGAPVLVKPFVENNARMERWLYRPQKGFLNSPKVYFILNEKGVVRSWSKEDPPGPAAMSPNATEKH